MNPWLWHVKNITLQKLNVLYPTISGEGSKNAIIICFLCRNALPRLRQGLRIPIFVARPSCARKNRIHAQASVTLHRRLGGCGVHSTVRCEVIFSVNFLSISHVVVVFVEMGGSFYGNVHHVHHLEIG